ncbi:MAG: PLP-dependent aminotransferase family protein [Alphaproteobacteria bacterium]|nr:PLP-dependent aminotransferase family protein [Alphaproteobacteria bacterium]
MHNEDREGRTVQSQRRRVAGEPYLYEAVVDKIAHMITGGTFRCGERIPSIRAMSDRLRVSVNTVAAAYVRLEDRGLVEARPQSGFYVLPFEAAPLVARRAGAPDEVSAKEVAIAAGAMAIIRRLSDPSLVPLATGAPNSALLPHRKLNALLAAEVRKRPVESTSYGSPRGSKHLRLQISRRLLTAGCSVTPEEITVTCGCVEAVTLALRATCRPGDAVAIGSPVYYTFLNAIRQLGLKLVEIPTHPGEGLDLDVLRFALRHAPVRAVVAILNFDNPLGCVMPDANKRRLVELLAAEEIPLIEDDVYAELGFSAGRPTSAKAYDRAGLVLHCASVSKTLAPGYRVGWIVAGRFQAEVEALKALTNIATPSPTQLAVAEFLATGGYDRHLRGLRRVYAAQVAQMRAAVARHFPPGTRISQPAGGSVLWVEMPAGVDSLDLYAEALGAGIAVVPGPLFTVGDDYRNCLRLSASTWTPRIEAAVAALGAMARGPAPPP